MSIRKSRKQNRKNQPQMADESKERYEVGDTVVYTIQSRNTVEDSLLENLKITDVLPEGLTFVEGSLEVSHGGTGLYEDGKITAEFGEVKDTDWRTVTFEATINAGYVRRDDRKRRPRRSAKHRRSRRAKHRH
jgi:uncharacterized repeat protein (TIGR01451 family)